MNKLKGRPFLMIFLLLAAAALWACEKPVTGTAAGDDTDDTDTGTSGDGDSDSDADSDADGDADDDTDTCANLDLTLERQPVTILLVIDHSASMDLQMGDNDTRWSVIVQALMGTSVAPETGLVWQMEDRVNFGMMLFTAVRNEPETCPLLDTVEPDLFNGDAIANICRADDETYKGASPVPEAISAATDMLTAMTGPGRRLILLATDGMPQTCDTLAVADDPEGRSDTIEAVEAAWTAGISTFVVGVGDEGSDEFLQQVADAGAGLSPDGSERALYYRGATENSLVDAIASVITEESRSCVYELDGKGVAAGEESAGHVLLDDVELEWNNADNGWRMKSPSEFELLGDACETIQLGDHHLEADFPCEVIVIIE